MSKPGPLPDLLMPNVSKKVIENDHDDIYQQNGICRYPVFIYAPKLVFKLNIVCKNERALYLTIF